MYKSSQSAHIMVHAIETLRNIEVKEEINISRPKRKYHINQPHPPPLIVYGIKQLE